MTALRFAADLAQSVGDRIAKNAVRQIRVSFKGEIDLVTQFDRQAQDFIVNAMTKGYPEYGVLSEENVSTGKGRPVRWIVDPLDGTTNFAHGLPIWAISIALEVEKEVVLGVVYDPTRKEIFTAIIDRGARLNGRRIYVSTTRRLGHSLLVTGFPYDIRRTKNNNLRQFGKFAVRARAVRRLGSAALDLCYTACGRFDGYWELKLSPWDQAAGSLILREAGGRVTDFAGRKFSIYGDEVLGTNGLIHGQMMSVLKRRRGIKPA
ncbi:MAG: inositol monophosphatase [candidate division WOR-3 bacterium]|nr:MAG: inositol monophosphatase [candidate division WOR-3 bacterium]